MVPQFVIIRLWKMPFLIYVECVWKARRVKEDIRFKVQDAGP
jgi:hypothetical protein